MKIASWEDRLSYLKLDSKIGDPTFGGRRYLNQSFYKSFDWLETRRQIILRDNGNDLAHEDYPIQGKILIHHINPITRDDLINHSEVLFDPENLICVSYDTHEAIHYGNQKAYIKSKEYVERRPNDTCPWKA
jgi:hypothetical protein